MYPSSSSNRGPHYHHQRRSNSVSPFRSTRYSRPPAYHHHHYEEEEVEEEEDDGGKHQEEEEASSSSIVRTRRSSTPSPVMMNPHVVPPSQHTLFMRGFNPNTEMHKIRDFFTKEGGKCSFDFFKVSQDQTRLFVALRFESKDVARDVLSKFDNTSVLGSKITITWFKDLRRARLKAMQHGQRWSHFYGNMKNGYNRGGYGHKFGKMKSAVWRGKGDHYGYMHDRRKRDRKHDSSSSRSRSYSHSRSHSRSRSKSRSRSRSRSHSRSRSWTHSRSRERSGSPSGRRYRSASSSSSRGSSRIKRRAWKSDSQQMPKAEATQNAEGTSTGDAPRPELPPDGTNMTAEAKGEEEPGNWEAAASNEADDTIKSNEVDELLELAQLEGASPGNEKGGNESEPSRSRSSSTSDHSHKDRKKKKKKHRSKHRRRHHHRHRHHRASSDEEGQVSDFEEGERSPSPDSHRRYRKRQHRSSSSSPERPSRKMEKRVKSGISQGLSLSHLSDGIQQPEELNFQLDLPLESEMHLMKSPRSLDVRSQNSDLSPLHVSEGDDELIAAQDKGNAKETPSQNEQRPAAGTNQQASHEENKDGASANNSATAGLGGLNEFDLDDIIGINPSAPSNPGTAQSQLDPSKLALRKNATKVLLDKYKSSFKTATTKENSNSSGPSGTARKTSPRRAGKSSHNSKKHQSSMSSMSKDKIALIRRKRAEIEKAYRRDCETFSAVVKMLVRKDPTLDEKLQDSFRENLFDIGQHCIRELQEFIEAIMSNTDSD